MCFCISLETVRFAGSSRVSSERDIGVDSLAHADDRLRRIPKRLIESLHAFIECMDLQIDLYAAQMNKCLFGVFHQRAAQALATLLRIDRNRVQPAAVPVITGKNGPDYTVGKVFISGSGDEKTTGPRQPVSCRSTGPGGYAVRCH